MHFIETSEAAQSTNSSPRSLGCPAWHRGTCGRAGEDWEEWEGWVLPGAVAVMEQTKGSGDFGKGGGLILILILIQGLPLHWVSPEQLLGLGLMESAGGFRGALAQGAPLTLLPLPKGRASWGSKSKLVRMASTGGAAGFELCSLRRCRCSPRRWSPSPSGTSCGTSCPVPCAQVGPGRAGGARAGG